MESKFSLTPLALDVFEAIKQAGGHVYLVGGCVRDFLLKRRSKDIDVEVHHLSFAALKEVLSSFGTVQVMGAAFAVVHLSTLDQGRLRQGAAPPPRRAACQDQGL